MPAWLGVRRVWHTLSPAAPGPTHSELLVPVLAWPSVSPALIPGATRLALGFPGVHGAACLPQLQGWIGGLTGPLCPQRPHGGHMGLSSPGVVQHVCRGQGWI